MKRQPKGKYITNGAGNEVPAYMHSTRLTGKRGWVPRDMALTPKMVLDAIEGSDGQLSKIATKLGCTYGTVFKVLRNPVKTRYAREEWDVVRRAWREEKSKLADFAESRLRQLMKQNKDLSTAAGLVKWVLGKLGSDEFREEQKNGTATTVVNGNLIQIEKLNLPLEVRRQLLAAMEASPQLEDGDGEVKMIEAKVDGKKGGKKKLKKSLRKLPPATSTNEADVVDEEA
jgi:hypothetical protein